MNDGSYIICSECGSVEISMHRGRIVGISFADGDVAADASKLVSIKGPVDQSLFEKLLSGDGELVDMIDFGNCTPFQRAVWEKVMEIAPGTTISYGELAKNVGSSGGARAVARALASNRVALLVPCHRVVHSDGSLGGYKWGAERKKALLEFEKKHFGG